MVVNPVVNLGLAGFAVYTAIWEQVSNQKERDG